MKSVASKIGYLKGLIEGLGVKDDSKEGKIICVMSEILDDISKDLEDVKESQNLLKEYVDTIDQDILSLQDDLYDEQEEEDSLLEDFLGIECPNCNETIYMDKDTFQKKESIECPNCSKFMSLEEIVNSDNLNYCEENIKNINND